MKKEIIIVTIVVIFGLFIFIDQCKSYIVEKGAEIVIDQGREIAKEKIDEAKKKIKSKGGIRGIIVNIGKEVKSIAKEINE